MTTTMLALFDLATGIVNEWIPLIVTDDDNCIHTSKGSWQVDLSAICNLWRQKGNDILIDYEHQGLPDANGKRQVAPAAGWIKELDVRNNALYARIEWLEKAKEFIKAQEYKYLSPAILIARNNIVVGLDSVALVNNPATYRAIPIALSADYVNAQNNKEELMEKLIALLGLKDTATEADVEDFISDLIKMRGLILATLDLPAESTIEAISKKINEFSDLQAKTVKALELSAQAMPDEIERKLTALSTNTSHLTALQAEIAQLHHDLNKREVEELVQIALSTGKIVPAQQNWAKEYAMTNIDGFRTYIETASAIAPLSNGLTPFTPDTNGRISDIDKAIMQACGVSIEDYTKYNK